MENSEHKPYPKSERGRSTRPKYGITWTVHYDSITDDKMSGKVVFGLPDENSSAGEITIRKKSNDAYSYEWYAKESGGVTAKGEAMVTRKTE